MLQDLYLGFVFIRYSKVTERQLALDRRSLLVTIPKRRDASHHEGPHGEAWVSPEAERRESRALRLSCDLCGKEWARQGRKASAFLIQV